MSKRTSFFLGLLTGAGLSAVATLILAPSDGQHNRDIMSYHFTNLKDKLLSLLKDREIYKNDAREKGEEHISFITSEAQRLKNEIDSLQKKIKNISDTSEES
jgi:gas vesicle protein